MPCGCGVLNADPAIINLCSENESLRYSSSDAAVTDIIVRDRLESVFSSRAMCVGVVKWTLSRRVASINLP